MASGHRQNSSSRNAREVDGPHASVSQETDESPRCNDLPSLMTISSRTDLLASYRPLPGAYDEMFTADGRIREHWAHAGQVIDTLGLAELLDRRSEAYR